MLAVRHLAADRPGPPEFRGRPLRIAVLQQAPDAGGRNRASHVGQQRHQGEPHAQLLGAPGEERRVAAAAMAEREVRAAHQVPCTQAAVQHVGHEGLGGHQAELVVERQLVEKGHAERRERVGAFRRQCQA